MNDVTLEALNFLDPADYGNDLWVRIGMALKADGYPVDVWDAWSKRDTRPGEYKPGECQKRWESFQSSGVTGAVILFEARKKGWEHEKAAVGKALEEDSVIEFRSTPTPAPAPVKLTPYEQLVTYLTTLFEPDDFVAFCPNTEQDADGKWKPTFRLCKYTRDEILDMFGREKRTDILSYNKQAGVWCNFNPMNGKGCKAENVTRFTHALVECDNLPLIEQRKAYERLKLPIKCLVSSGKRSLHAIVHIGAKTKEEYKQRVSFLYDFLKKQGIELDEQCKNAARLSRMPGFERDGSLQELLAVNIGKANWDEWYKSLEEIPNADKRFPSIRTLRDTINQPLPLKPEIIHGLLRQGAKMMIAGASKSGKTWNLIQLAMAIATGGNWMGYQCSPGKVLYVNFEVDGAEMDKRINTVIKAHSLIGIEDNVAIDNFHTWNLRGFSEALNEKNALETEIIKSCKGMGFRLIIFDPIYKLNGGDENSAEDVNKLLLSFERIAVETETAIVFAHHHSKGALMKSTMEQFSGSGVFLRDPDAIINFQELEIPQNAKLPQFAQPDSDSSILPSAWRATFSVRSFKTPEPINLFYRYPLHYADTNGTLSRAKVKSNTENTLDTAPIDPLDKIDQIVTAIEELEAEHTPATAANLYKKLGASKTTFYRWMDDERIGCSFTQKADRTYTVNKL